MTRSCISVVLPVYNEHANIAECLRGLWKALASFEHEILVCYDFDQDSTLPAIAAMPDAPPSVRLVKNELGRGAANAIRAGFAAAQGDVVVTTMADLSDPPEVIPKMAEKIRNEGAAVVAGSRYMRGGSQSGGPLLKRVLSQTAGLSLRVCTGIGTLDATSNFRAYARRYLERVQIESRAGFEIALELTIKAHMLGEKVAEVPSDWRDRSAGTSRFRMWKWMPNYLRWYWEAMAAPVFVFAVWAAMTWFAIDYLDVFSSSIPFWDDLELAGSLGSKAQLTLHDLWAPHNEHRLFLPRLIMIPLIESTRSFQSAMYAQVLLLALVSMGFILATRAIRGRTHYADAFFPLLWLHWGNAANLSWAFQLSIVVPAALVCSILMFATASRAPLGWRTTLGIGVGLLLLPLCGANGLAYVPALAAWSIFAGVAAWRSRAKSERARGTALLACSLATLALAAYYFVDFKLPTNNVHAPDLKSAFGTAVKFASLSIGPAARDYWPLAALFVGLVSLVSIVLLSVVMRERPLERQRAGALLATMLGLAMLAACVGFGRGGMSWGAGFASRYVTLPSVLLCCVYLTWSLYGPPAIGRFVRIVLFTVMCMLVSYNVRFGVNYGIRHMGLAAAFAEDLNAGLGPTQLAERHWEHFFSDQKGFAVRLKQLSVADRPPFMGLPQFEMDEGDAPDPYFMFKRKPIAARSVQPIAARKLDGAYVLVIAADSELEFELLAGARVVSGQFGVLPAAYTIGATDGVLFKIELARPDEQPITVFERRLDPRNRESDRGQQSFSVELPAGGSGTLALRTTNAPGCSEEMDWSYWTKVDIE